MILLPILFACSDYDLHREKEGVPPAEDTSTPPAEPVEGPDILLEPTTIDFGAVQKDCPAEPIRVTITNKGLGDLEITEISFDGDGHADFEHGAAAFFQIQDTGSSGAEKIVLTPVGTEGDSVQFYAYFTPSFYLDYELELAVKSNDPDESTATSNVSGQGSGGSLYEEGFVQEINEMVDVLWVFDTSSSMDDEITNVKNNFSSFLGSFLSLGLDYQMAIVTTDLSEGGVFQGSPTIMTTAMGQSAVQSTFNQTLDMLGTDGSTTEVGLDVTHAALTGNPSFIRSQDVGLSVIIVSDEDDNGSSLRGQSFISWFQGLKPTNPSLARVSAFLSSGDLFGNGTYEEVINATGGYIADIDSSSYEQPLHEIALAAAGMTVSFQLSETPANVSGITVEINGMIVAQDLFDGWTYDPNTNSITFHGDSIPEFGAVVNVSYEVMEECGQ